MPRHRTIWDSTLGQQVDIEFTAAEEIARDEEEAAAAIERVEADAKEAELARLNAELADDSITLDGLKSLMRLERGR